MSVQPNIDKQEPMEDGRTTSLPWYRKSALQTSGKPSQSSLPFSDLRTQGKAALSSLQFPNTGDEEWKYTNFAAVERTVFATPKGVEKVATDLIPQYKSLSCGEETITITFADGELVPHLSKFASLPKGVSVLPFSALLTDADQHGDAKLAVKKNLGRHAQVNSHFFAALNTSELPDGVLVQVAERTEISTPIQITFLSGYASEPSVTHPRVLISLGAGARAVVVERYFGVPSSNYFTNSVTEVSLGAESHLQHVTIQDESKQSHHFGALFIEQKEKSVLTTHVLNLGGRTVRNEVYPVLNGQHTETHLFGLNVISDDQRVDNTTVLDHASPNCFSRELYKGIYGGKSSGAFSGTIVVRPDAQKTNAIQSNQSILLSEDAESNSRPQLKIFADDVKCTHGATVGQLDDDALFYLRSRGIPEAEARSMLIGAFASEVLENLPIASLREAIATRLFGAHE